LAIDSLASDVERLNSVLPEVRQLLIRVRLSTAAGIRSRIRNLLNRARKGNADFWPDLNRLNWRYMTQ